MELRQKNLLDYISEIVKIGDFILSSGKKSNFYIDCKEIMLKPDVMVHIANNINHITYGLSYSLVAGVTSGADPIVCSCVLCNKNNGLFIRKKQKDYGTKKLIEGSYSKNNEVLIVDDVLTTGNSIIYAYETLIEHNLKPVGVVVIVDRQENDMDKLKEILQIPIFSIFTKTKIMTHIEGK
jgi:orotate phosphoribosyltransferase